MHQHHIAHMLTVAAWYAGVLTSPVAASRAVSSMATPSSVRPASEPAISTNVTPESGVLRPRNMVTAAGTDRHANLAAEAAEVRTSELPLARAGQQAERADGATPLGSEFCTGMSLLETFLLRPLLHILCDMLIVCCIGLLECESVPVNMLLQWRTFLPAPPHRQAAAYVNPHLYLVIMLAGPGVAACKNLGMAMYTRCHVTIAVQLQT